MAKSGYKSQAQLDERVATFDTNAPNVEQKRKLEAMQKGALIADEIERRGGTIPLDGINEVGQPVSTLGMSDKEKFFAVGRLQDKQQLKGYASYGDKYLAEAKNAVREITGRAPIANTPEEFNKLIDKSVAFGGESALLTPEGRTRAMKQGVGVGLSYQEADAAVQGAFDFLNKKYGKKDTTPATTPATTPSVGVPLLLAKPEESTANSTTSTQQKADIKPPTIPPTAEEYGTVEFGRDILKGVGLTEYPAGSETAVKEAFNALRNLGKAQRVTDDELKRLRVLEAQATMEPSRFKTAYEQMSSDISDRAKRYQTYDEARNKLIGATAPYIESYPVFSAGAGVGGSNVGYQERPKKDIVTPKINEIMRKVREQQQYPKNQ